MCLFVDVVVTIDTPNILAEIRDAFMEIRIVKDICELLLPLVLLLSLT